MGRPAGILLLMRLMLLIRARPAPALELAAGGGLVEQGDDVVRPAAKIHLGFTDHVFMEAVVFGRTFGPVTERSTLLGLAGRAALFGGTGLLGRFGLTVLDEYTAIERTDPDRAVLAEHSYNAGLLLGVSRSFHPGPLRIDLAWDSRLYPAGVSSLLLVTGRKQVISLTLGADL